VTLRVIALGSELGGDDAAALRVAEALAPAPGVEVLLAGRPGPGLVELFEEGVRVVLLDVVRRGLSPGEVVTLALSELGARGLSSGSLTSHDLGPIEALRLGEALGRPRPEGLFVGLGGARFAPGPELSEEVARALPAFRDAATGAIARLRQETR
jgi:hydrogenase maturation protease